MGKLFSITDDKSIATEEYNQDKDDVLDSLSDMLVEGIGDLNSTSEATHMAVEHLECIEGMYNHIQTQKLCSSAYVYSIENYSPLVKTLGSRMGVKHMPAMEDFSNPYAAKTCHEYAMEGFREMISKAWEKIKAFFRDFFKKITLFIKRVVKANLDLESYEKYCEQLIAKLNLNKATISDSKAVLNSELPKLLAGKGQESISADYILNQGFVKVKNLLTVVDEIIRSQNGVATAPRLAEFYKELTKFIEVNSSNNPQSTQELIKSIGNLKSHGFSLLSGLFPYNINGIRSVPPKPYERLMQYYDGKSVNLNDLVIMSLADPLDPYKELPQGVNMYISHVDTDDLFITSGKEEPPMIPNTVGPISNLNNLTTFHKEYKATLGKLNMGSLDKSSEQVSKEIDKLLGLLYKEFGAVVNNSRGVPKSYTLEFLVYLLSNIFQSSRPINHEDFLSIVNNEFNDRDEQYKELNIDTFSRLTETLEAFYEAVKRKDSVTIKKAISVVNMSDTFNAEYVKFLINTLIEKYGDVIGGIANEDTQRERYAILQGFNKYLVNLFTCIQTVYRDLMTNFFATITSVRYAVIKYIYDSAKLYSY